MFPVWHITATALLTALLASGTTILAQVMQRQQRSFAHAVLVGGSAGLGILLWRLGANTPTLNTDTIPAISPADVLSAPVAYVAVGIAAGLRRGAVRGASERVDVAQAMAALVALIVNIISI